jgi:hypothetical protein
MADTDDRDQRELRFHRLYQANFRLIAAYAANRTGSADDAADIVAEVFTTAWRRLDDVPLPLMTGSGCTGRRAGSFHGTFAAQAACAAWCSAARLTP